jgi:hypothetical protein
MKDDDIGGVIAVIAVVAVGWWLWNKYEVRERPPEPPPINISAPTPAPSPTGFVDLTVLNTGTVWRLDAATVSGPRTARRAWVTADYSKDQSVAYRVSKSLRLVDCETGAVKELAFIAYDSEGKVQLSDEYTPEEAKSHYYPPETVGASVPAEVCKPIYDGPSNGDSRTSGA